VNGAALERQARRILRKVGAQMDSVEFFECPTDRVWTRDYGPLFVRNRREVAATDYCFRIGSSFSNNVPVATSLPSVSFSE
jgi:agmatine deiminase